MYPSKFITQQQYNWLEIIPDKRKYALLLQWQRSLLNLFDPRVFGIPEENSLKYMYSYVSDDNLKDVLQVKSLDHTMYDALDEYVSQKLPFDEIRRCIVERTPIEVHGIYPSHFTEISEFLGFRNIVNLKFHHNISNKEFNVIRPSYYYAWRNSNEKIMLICVPPGRDYVLHYASLIRHLLSIYTRDSDKILQIHRYPFIEDSIHIWSGLDNKIITSGDIVLLGYVKEFADYLGKQGSYNLLSEYENEYFVSRRIILSNNKVINLLGVKFSFWGNICAKLCYQICRLGAKEILYFGKLGALTAPNDLYTKIFSPTKYMILYHDKLICKIVDLENKLASMFPEINTEYHVSVPTVLEEDYVQRSITSELRINSIDNEISQVAYAIRKYNEEFDKSIPFSAIHFATDYVRQFEKPELETPHDLSNNRTQIAKKKKELIIQKISQIIYEYLTKS